MVKVSEELPRNADGTAHLDKWAQRVSDAHEHLDKGFLAYVAQGLAEAAPELLDSGLELAEVVAELNMDQGAVSAAMLYRGIREQRYVEDFVATSAGSDAARICMAVAAMATTSLLEMSNSPLLEKEQRDQVENIKRMLVAMIDDVRVAVVKLAERLLALRRAKTYELSRRQRVADEALTIFSPLAGRLGIFQLKWEMEDLALRYREPDIYQTIAGRLQGKRTDREQQVAHMVDQVRGLLRSQGIEATVYGRAKNIFSIWRKMQNKGVDFDQVMDVRAVRVVVENLADCYAALGMLHSTWQHIPAEFDDYIANPKENGYQSIHTAVTASDGRPLEIQIRTRAMHEDAELGICAHWSYKSSSEGGHAEDEKFGEKMNWLRQVIEWHEELDGTESLRALLSHRMSDERIFVSTPKGHVLDLPVDATVLDFAYRVHTEVGHSTVSARVNGEPALLRQQLKTGQQVEIMTTETALPLRQWLEPSLGFVTTDRARAKLVRYFHGLPSQGLIALGRDQFAEVLSALGYDMPDDALLEEFVGNTGVSGLNEFWHKLGNGELSLVDALGEWLGQHKLNAQLNLPGLPPTQFPMLACFRIVGENRDGLLHDITQVVGDVGLALSGTTGRVSNVSSQAIITVDVTLADWRQTIRFASLIALLDGVLEIRRIAEEPAGTAAQ